MRVCPVLALPAGVPSWGAWVPDPALAPRALAGWTWQGLLFIMVASSSVSSVVMVSLGVLIWRSSQIQGVGCHTLFLRSPSCTVPHPECHPVDPA